MVEVICETPYNYSCHNSGQIVMFMQECRVYIFEISQEKPFYAQVSFVLHVFFLDCIAVIRL